MGSDSFVIFASLLRAKGFSIPAGARIKKPTSAFGNVKIYVCLSNLKMGKGVLAFLVIIVFAFIVLSYVIFESAVLPPGIICGMKGGDVLDIYVKASKISPTASAEASGSLGQVILASVSDELFIQSCFGSDAFAPAVEGCPTGAIRKNEEFQLSVFPSGPGHYTVGKITIDYSHSGSGSKTATVLCEGLGTKFTFT